MLSQLVIRLYRRLERSRAAALLQLGPVQAYRARTRGVRDVSLADLKLILERVHGAGVTGHLVGGWGVDALVGHQTRLHDDVDLAYEARSGSYDALLGALGALGFSVREIDLVPHALFPVRVLLSDGDGRSVDLLPYRATAGESEPPPEIVADQLPRFGGDAFVPAVLHHRRVELPVSCLSSDLQLDSRRRYEHRPSDRHDIARLERLGRRPVVEGG